MFAVVPLGISEYFRDAGYEHVVELDWEETITLRKIKFTALLQFIGRKNRHSIKMIRYGPVGHKRRKWH